MSATKVYAARVKNGTTLAGSSSGGVFTAFTDVFLNRQEAVVCAVYNYEKKQTEFRIITDKTTRDSARGSKYMQSIPGNIFRETEEWLNANKGKQLLFIGMGCQAAGLEKYAEIKGFRDRVTIMDIICHGSPSPLIWKEYADELERRHKGRIEWLNFKDKRKGWLYPVALVRINNAEIFLDDYIKLFYSGCILRPACHKCPYATVKRNVDITIGDYWGVDRVRPDFFDRMGNSLVLLHTEKGEALFESCKEEMEYVESNIEDCLQPNLKAPTRVSNERTAFWQEYHKHGINFITRKYGTVNVLQKLKSRWNRITVK